MTLLQILRLKAWRKRRDEAIQRGNLVPPKPRTPAHRKTGSDVLLRVTRGAPKLYTHQLIHRQGQIVPPANVAEEAGCQYIPDSVTILVFKSQGLSLYLHILTTATSHKCIMLSDRGYCRGYCFPGSEQSFSFGQYQYEIRIISRPCIRPCCTSCSERVWRHAEIEAYIMTIGPYITAGRNANTTFHLSLNRLRALAREKILTMGLTPA